MLNIVIPMAGLGSRFSDAGYTIPKPLIKIKDKSMIRLVIENLTPSIEHKFIFICQKVHITEHSLLDEIKNVTKSFEIIEINKITDGPASTVLLARDFFENDDPIMIANCDQYVDIDIDDYLIKMKLIDGLIMTMWADDPKWSFVKFDQNKNIIEVVEKKVVSNVATVGIYNFSNGKTFCKYADMMVKRNDRVNNEFYVAPIYNYLLKDRKIISTYDITNNMYGLGTPEDLKKFLEHF